MIALWGREPVAISGLILAFVNLLIVFAVLHLTVQQIGAINMFLAAFFAFVVRNAVTPIANPRDADGNRLVPMASWQRPKVEGKPR
ncbi:MAG TPA: hypothetical protein VJP81_05960 [Candidatus Dormibacteraeota bacterium]|nr:hypothetical protein [Candidatus Dormibacteraeota bacterium]